MATTWPTTIEPCSPLTALQRDFAALADTGAVDAALAAWATRDPALAEVSTMTALTAVLCGDDHDRHNAVLIALLRIAAAPDADGELAARIVLARFVGAAVRIVARIVHRSSTGEDPTDVQALVLSHLWERVRCYPLHRTQHVAANLVRDTQTAVEQELGVHCRQHVSWRSGARRAQLVPISCAEADDATDDVGDSTIVATARSASEELLELLAWALEQQWLDEQTARILVARYFGPVHGRDGVATDRQVGALVGASHSSVTRLRCRAERHLAAAAEGYAAVQELAS